MLLIEPRNSAKSGEYSVELETIPRDLWNRESTLCVTCGTYFGSVRFQGATQIFSVNATRNANRLNLKMAYEDMDFRSE